MLFFGSSSLADTKYCVFSLVIMCTLHSSEFNAVTEQFDEVDVKTHIRSIVICLFVIASCYV